MYKYSSNYCTEGNNYVIKFKAQHVSDNILDSSIYSTYCVVENIIQRGSPTKPSSFLKEKIGCYKSDKSIKYVCNYVPIWDNTIKGNKDGDNPALYFYKTILENEFVNYPFLRNLIVPEARFTDMTNDENERFYENYADFFIPQCRLVIEIDGIQHSDENNRLSDMQRDSYLKQYGINVIRIPVSFIKQYMTGQKAVLTQSLSEIRKYIDESQKIQKYRESYKRLNDILTSNETIYDSVMHFQITILQLLKNGKLSLEDSSWNINILNNDNTKIPFEAAIKDLFNWFQWIMKLQLKEITLPTVNIKVVDKFNTTSGLINIDFSLFRRIDERCNDESIIYVRSDFYDDVEYYRVATAEVIRYKIIQEGKERNEDILYKLNSNIFGFSGFNPGQLPIIKNALELKDTIGLLPTGGGKSLCYQFCCMLQPTINFSIVPIKSLMYDQKSNLDKKGITHTNYISSDQSGAMKEAILHRFHSCRYQCIWISPERFQIQAFRDAIEKINHDYSIGYAVVDEVHCLSEWGHDFRTSYLNLSKTIRRLCPAATIMGLTATASKNVLNDILVEFGLKDENIKTILDYTRNELNFRVIEDDNNRNDDKYDNLCGVIEYLDNHNNILELNGNKSKCGIIFTPHVNGRYGCYGISNKLSERFHHEVKYYSGEVPKINRRKIMSENDFNKLKQETQKEFIDNKFTLLVATKSFGMGIDKENIRYTIHYGTPISIEAFYQEAGRAGRDKKKAVCYLLYSKDNISDDEERRIFALNTTSQELDNIRDSHKFEAGDILRNLFFITSGHKGVDHEAVIIDIIYNNFCRVKKPYISLRELNTLEYSYSFLEVQSAIYRLSLLGVITDWTIEEWDIRGRFKIFYGSDREEDIRNNLEAYIRKYDKEFSIKGIELPRYKSYGEIFLNPDYDNVEKYTRMLLQWTYDNILYSRRQSQKNLIDLCTDYFTRGEVYFKNKLESYFKIDDLTYQLDYFADNPKDVEKIFDLILDRDGNLIRISKIEEIKNSLARFLESYRYNTSLNYLSGLISLILDIHDENSLNDRLYSAFETLVNDNCFDEEIFSKTMSIGRLLSENNKAYLSDLMIKFNLADKYYLYEELCDYNSLGLILGDSLKKVKSVGRRLKND